jgi:hypothetical protein
LVETADAPTPEIVWLAPNFTVELGADPEKAVGVVTPNPS